MISDDTPSLLQKPIFLDFLNREANAASGYSRSESDDFGIIEILLLTHCNRMSANISQMVEYCSGKHRLSQWIQLLIKSGILVSTSHDTDMSCFISERQKLYSHDRERYPMYFDDTSQIEGFSITGNNSFSMSKLLRRDLFAIDPGALDLSARRARGDDRQIFTKNADFFQKTAMAEKDSAITKSLFLKNSKQLDGNKDLILGSAARIFSALYMDHYADQNSCISCTGIFSTGYAEEGKNFPLYDVPTLRDVVNSLGYYQSEACQSARKQRSISHYGSAEHRRFAYLCSAFLEAVLTLIAVDRSNQGSWLSVRGSIAEILSSVVAPIRQQYSATPKTITDFLKIGSDIIVKSAEHLAGKSGIFKDKWRKFVPEPKTVSFLLLVATDIEEDELHLAIETAGYQRAANISIDRGIVSRYVKLPTIELFVCRSSAGGSGVSGSHLVASDAIRSLKPGFVISSGICFGFEEKGLSIGDIIVSESITNYETVRQGSSEIRERGNNIPCGPTLLSSAREVMRKYRKIDDGPKAKSGLVLSGEKLIDSVEFMNALSVRFPDALGGEMEGVGINSSSTAKGVEWILVKAICDWGHDKGKKNQKLAATTSSKFTMDLIDVLIESKS